MKKVSNILWGVVLIVIGVISGLNALEITDINIFFKGWWTLFIIVPCFIGIFNDESKTGNLIGLVIGVVLLLGSRDIISFEIIGKLIVPIVLIGIGLSIIFKDTLNSKVSKKIKQISKENKNLNDYTATFGGQKVKYPNKEFEGATSNAIFGGVDMNLKDAIISKDVVINATAIFGGIDIFVPSNVNVEVKSTAIFGGTSNKTMKVEGDNVHTIYVNSFALFGGVDIK